MRELLEVKPCPIRIRQRPCPADHIGCSLDVRLIGNHLHGKALSYIFSVAKPAQRIADYPGAEGT